jgi:hypothetical protein
MSPTREKLSIFWYSYSIESWLAIKKDAYEEFEITREDD